MREQSEKRRVNAQRVRAAWRVRACGVGLCAGAQVFLFGTGMGTQLCANAAWLCAFCALPMTAFTAWQCQRTLKERKGSDRYPCVLQIILLSAFWLDAVFASASLLSLAGQALLPQTRSAHSLLVSAAAILLCALSGASGVYRLSFALRGFLPVVIAVLCAISLPLNVSIGLFPLLGTGLRALGVGSACMLGAALPALLLLYIPPELEGLTQEEMQIPRARFFVLRATLGAAAGEALLFVLTLGSTYESILSKHTWGSRLLILSSGSPREGLAQMALTLAEMMAILLLTVHMLLGAKQAAENVCPRLKHGRMSLFLCTGLLAAGLYGLLFVGDGALTAIAPCLLALLLAALVLSRMAGGKHEEKG